MATTFLPVRSCTLKSCASAGSSPRKRLSGSATPKVSLATKSRPSRIASASPRGFSCVTTCTRSGIRGRPAAASTVSFKSSLPGADTMSTSRAPLAAHSSITRSTRGTPAMGSSSLAAPLVSDDILVPFPPQGISALVRPINSPDPRSWRHCPRGLATFQASARSEPRTATRDRRRPQPTHRDRLLRSRILPSQRR